MTATAPPTIDEQARAALQDLIGHPLSDDDWQRYSARLIAFVRLLRSWDKTLGTTERLG